LIVFFLCQQVYLIEYQHSWYTIGFTGCQESVDERGARYRMIDRYNQGHLVNVRCQYMALFAKVGGAPNDIVFSFFDIRYPFIRYLDIVAYGDRVRTTDASDAKITFDSALYILPIVQPNDVTAACGFNDETSHYNLSPITVIRS
jgi:hypothetical protein